ncbi:hypothetical protein GGS21DRAFT_511870 [Xylaria nigripes]|nr:hypothetical protein GGS21DRAFT_511870 [Xylaria nigripes]
MAPWSSWFQSNSRQPPPPQPPLLQQQQLEQQQQHHQSLTPIPSNLLSSPTPSPPLETPSHGKKNEAYKPLSEPTELRLIANKSLRAGMVTGGIGLIVGAGMGIVRSAPPTLFALFASVQWFALGSSYMASRELLYRAWGGEENLTSSEYVQAGGLAGAVSGITGGMLRGPRNVLPGMLFFGSLGAGSSYVSQWGRDSPARPRRSLLDSKWSPMQRLSDRDYMDKIEEKMLRLDAEIAIIDETIASIKEESGLSAEPTTK